MALSDLFSRRRKPQADDTDTGPDDGPVYSTKVLPRFLATLNGKTQPTLLDCGPVVGQNVSFFGEHLGCKIFVEDLYKDVDRHVRDGLVADLPRFLEARFPEADNSIDGIICWDIFDYLERPAAQALTKQLIRILKPTGALLALFASTAATADATEFTRYVVANPTSLQHRPYRTEARRQKPLLNRDIERMFAPLRVTEQFLLKSHVREVLFRKPSAPVAVPPAVAGQG